MKAAVLAGLVLLANAARALELKDGAYQVHPGDRLQAALDMAATNPVVKTVRVHPGTYAPEEPRQALAYLNRNHDGIRLVGLGRPTLTAANPGKADRSAASFPAIVNHVLYLGDGLSTNTIIENFRLTGANHFVTNSNQSVMEPDQELRKGRFYFGDGGAVKIYRSSYPVLRNLEIVDNYASPCAGGISIQHEDARSGFVRIENCVFRNNRSEVTGAALDLLWGSSARVTNCLFVANVSNTGPGEGENPFKNNGAITVFQRSRLVLDHCTLTGNRNGVDDMGGLSTYVDCLFVDNTLEGGTPGQPRFELDLQAGGKVRRCVVQGRLLDPRRMVDASTNQLSATGIAIDAKGVPTGGGNLNGAGYRPTAVEHAPGN